MWKHKHTHKMMHVAPEGHNAALYCVAELVTELAEHIQA